MHTLHRQERLAPKAELSAVERALRPSSSAISSGSVELDVLPPSDAELRASPELRQVPAAPHDAPR